MPRTRASVKENGYELDSANSDEQKTKDGGAKNSQQSFFSGVRKPSDCEHADERSCAAGALQKPKALGTDMKHVAGKHRHEDQIGHAEHAVEKNHADKSVVDLVLTDKIEALGHMLQDAAGRRCVRQRLETYAQPQAHGGERSAETKKVGGADAERINQQARHGRADESVYLPDCAADGDGVGNIFLGHHLR